jgi:hypothetical protein
MNLPTLPTENIYKFMALSGLALLIFSFTFPSRLADELELKAVEVTVEGKLISMEVSELQGEVESAKSNPNLSIEDKISFTHKLTQLNTKLIQFSGNNLRLSVLHKQASHALNLSLSGFFFGLITAFFGFIFWYIRIQKPADLLLKKQATIQINTPRRKWGKK